jgi:hypothetical protein
MIRGENVGKYEDMLQGLCLLVIQDARQKGAFCSIAMKNSDIICTITKYGIKYHKSKDLNITHITPYKLCSSPLHVV